MELELHRVDLLQTSAAAPGTLAVGWTVRDTACTDRGHGLRIPRQQLHAY